MDTDGNQKSPTAAESRYKRYRLRAFVAIVLAAMAVALCMSMEEAGDLSTDLGDANQQVTSLTEERDEARGLATSQQQIIEELEDTVRTVRQVLIETVDTLESTQTRLAQVEEQMVDTITKLNTVIEVLPESVIVIPPPRKVTVPVKDERFDGEIEVEIPGVVDVVPVLNLSNMNIRPVPVAVDLRCVAVNRPAVDLEGPAWINMDAQVDSVVPDVCQPPEIGHDWYSPQVSDGVIITVVGVAVGVATFWWWEAR